jgi:hypothetical protein
MRLVGKMLFIVSAAFLTAGCAAFRDPNSVVSLDNEKSKVFVTQADKRAIFTFPNRAAYACPEPSPDVKADVESAIKALLDASSNLPNSITAAAKVELDTTRKLITAALLQRSQGLQVLRDMLFQACLANLRGDMEPIRYMDFVTRILPNLTTTLITSEMVTKTNGSKAVLGGEDLKSFLNFVIGNSQK